MVQADGLGEWTQNISDPGGRMVEVLANGRTVGDIAAEVGKNPFIRAKDRNALKMRLRDLAMTWVRFGYLRLTVMLIREGWDVGKKLVYRLYRELGLQMRTRKRKKLANAQRGPVEAAV